jgi:hypothetical protein
MDFENAPEVPLAAAIGQVRRELETAIEEGKDSPVKFRVGPVELDFDVTFEGVAGVDAGVRVWVISAGAKSEARRGTSHHLKVTLTPLDQHGKEPLIFDEGDY